VHPGRSNIRYEVVVVDDASPDGTQEVVHALAAVYGEDVVRLAARPGKLGLGASRCRLVVHVHGVLPLRWTHHTRGRCNTQGARTCTA
jgi:glycosyltransferase involved in cell wall biosynthesis